ncbi:MAG TPA: TIGR02678 family protein [Intrasporangium sp.]|uniref:TIGR02678 family protein n=1 Tax=Intrasporangium sp. TaxID=1925024 RepID=UPI002D79FDE0|nr:TIGR02678 family protein [Intrasporangium sp.]HET7398968.1 TIGR02678 family protein [Intrasporangium sp.]
MSSPGFVRPPTPEDSQDLEERRAGARALLAHPLMTRGGPHDDELRLVRRHRVALTRFFAEALGYRLTVEPVGARLFKPGLGRDGTRPLLRRSKAPFTPRMYALLVLTIAALTRSRPQLLVDELVAAVRSAAVEADVAVDLDAIGDRRALHAALTVLVGLGALSERDGDLEHWAEKHTQSLLDVNRDVLALLVSAQLGAARSRDDLLQPPAVPSAAGGARMATRRRLLESPVLTTDELPADHAEWWRRNRNREREWFHDQFGLELELRAEGALATDPQDELTDVDFPGRGKTSHLALLVLEALVEEVRPAVPRSRASADPQTHPWHALSAERVAHRARAVVDDWSSGLRKDQREDPEAAARQALSLLVSVGLLRAAPAGAGQGWLLHAAAARYRPVAEIIAPSRSGEASLFDLEELQ